MRTSKKLNSIWFLLGMLLLVVTTSLHSCTDDLEKLPLNADTDNVHFTSVAAYKQSLAGAYSKMAYSTFLRFYWSMQEYSTDMAVSTWNDGGDGIYHELAWSADSPAIANVYTSALTMITLCNDFINQSSDELLSKRGFSGADAAEIKRFQAEARYLRAYCFWILMDCYGNPPFPTEKPLANPILSKFSVPICLNL